MLSAPVESLPTSGKRLDRQARGLPKQAAEASACLQLRRRAWAGLVPLPTPCRRTGAVQPPCHPPHHILPPQRRGLCPPLPPADLMPSCPILGSSQSVSCFVYTIPLCSVFFTSLQAGTA